MVMPAAITTPIEKRLAAPAPLAVSSGIMPTTIAAVVIRMGLSRTDAARSMASRADKPCVSRNWLANSVIRMPCLEMSPINVTSPIWL